MAQVAARTEWAGRCLVALQFVLLAVMGWRGAVSMASLGITAMLLMSASAGLAVWSLAANRPGNFNIRPTPKLGGALVTNGPYRWVRHPMYSSLLLAAAAAAALSGRAGDAGLWLALLAVLWAKSGMEERALVVRFSDYPPYRARTGRFLPRLI